MSDVIAASELHIQFNHAIDYIEKNRLNVEIRWVKVPKLDGEATLCEAVVRHGKSTFHSKPGTLRDAVEGVVDFMSRLDKPKPAE